MTLLPGNATSLERQAAQALAQIQRVPVPIRDLLSPERCPVHLLPYLAWAFSVDRWDSKWPEAAKRRAIRSSFFVHARKGTIGALRRVVEPLGYLIEVVEWFNAAPEGVAGTFSLMVGVTDNGIDEQTYLELARLVDDAKPLTRHLIRLDISLETRIPAYHAVPVLDGDVLEVYPWEASDIEVSVAAHNRLIDHTQDTLDVYLYG